MQIQNRGPHAETIKNATVLADLVKLTADSLGSCTAPEIKLTVGSPQVALPFNREEMLSLLNSTELGGIEPVADKFTVLEGRSLVYSRITQMVIETKERLEVVTSGQGVIEAYRSGLLDYGFERKEDVHFQLLTSLSTISNNLDVTKELLKRAEKASLCFESRIGDFGAGYFPRFLIRDGTELLIFLKMDGEEHLGSANDTGLWTNNRVMVHGFSVFFDIVWNDSKDIHDAIREYEHTKPDVKY